MHTCSDNPTRTVSGSALQTLLLIQLNPPLNQPFNPSIKFFPHLRGQHMSLALDEMLLNLTFLPNIVLLFNTQPILFTRHTLAILQSPPQYNAQREREHTILGPVDDHDSVLADRRGNLLELLRALVMPPRGNGL